MNNDYPGVQFPDSKRTPFGLGWEYKRRGLSITECPFITGSKEAIAFEEGFKVFHCNNPKTNVAMVRHLQ